LIILVIHLITILLIFVHRSLRDRQPAPQPAPPEEVAPAPSSHRFLK
jgi:hypothetical protein